MESSDFSKDKSRVSRKSLWNEKNEGRRHWNLSHHCTNAMYPQSIWGLELPSREARFYWQLYTINGRQEPLYEINLTRALLRSLKRAHGPMKLKNISVSSDVMKLKRLDYFERKRIIDALKTYIMNQKELLNFSMESLHLKRMEGIELVLSLKNSRKTLQYLHCWKAFQSTESPLLVDTGNFNGSGVYRDRVIRQNEWLKAIGYLEVLTTLSLNYAYIATPEGDFLIELSKRIGEHWNWLQLLCIQTEIPIVTNPNDGIGGHRIPDCAWKKAIDFAPELKVQFVFVDIPEYDNQKRFLSRSIPVHTMIMTRSVEARYHDPPMIDCTMKMLWFWYSKSLVHLSLQLWHHEESLDSHLKKILIHLPNLKIFEFTGEIKDIKTLHVICSQIQSQQYKIRHVDFHLQKPINEEVNEITWKNDIFNLLLPFQKDFNNLKLQFSINFYPM